MRGSVLIAIGALIVAFSARPAAGQEGAPPLWPEVVQRFVEATERWELEAAQRLLADRSLLQSFRGEPSVSLNPVCEAVARGTVLFVRAYERPPTALAEELATVFEQSSIIPNEARQWLIPPDEQTMRQANTIANQWVMQALQVRSAQPVAVVAVWLPAQSRSVLQSAGGELFFVLLRGESGETDSRITAVVFGVPVVPSQR